MANGIVMYGTAWCGDCALAKRVFAQQGVPYEWIDLDERPEAVPFVRKVNRGMRSVPTIVFPDGSTLTEPSARQLEEKLALFR